MVLYILILFGCATVSEPNTEYLVIYVPPFSGEPSCAEDGWDKFLLNLQRGLDSWVIKGKYSITYNLADEISVAKDHGADILILGTVNIIKSEDYPTNGSSTVKVYDVTRFEMLTKFESSHSVRMGWLPIPPPDVDYCHSVPIAVRKTANDVIDFIKWDYVDKY